ncbi:MAG: hypothetical protein N2662_04135 [Bacteroidales bacterium]|nr:hypothetical protein [Bacteroidales bacterium]
MKTKIFAIVLFIIGLVSCSETDDYNLTTSIFIEDPEWPGLPQYSEWGYNTFGAYIDRVAFTSTDYQIPGKVIIKNDSLMLVLKGNYKNSEATMIFKMVGYSFNSYSELIALNGDTIDFKRDSSKIVFNNNEMEVIEGRVIFKKVQRLFVDEQEAKCIVSGTFQFKYYLGVEPIAVSQGRFDLGIGYDNFFNLNGK